jgi:hypothetical protein
MKFSSKVIIYYPTFTPPYNFIPQCLIKHSDGFTFYLKVPDHVWQPNNTNSVYILQGSDDGVQHSELSGFFTLAITWYSKN